MAIMLFSALTNLNPEAFLKIFVLDGGISERNKAKVLTVLHNAGRKFDLQWIKVSGSNLDHFPASSFVTWMAYSRLLIPDLVPVSEKRIIYLDCDVIVRADLSAMWRSSFDGLSTLGVRDYSFPSVSSAGAYLDWQQLGLSRNSAYCNSGVLMMDLEMWRRNCLSRHMIEYLARYSDKNVFFDQDAINAILNGQWRLLDPRWNVQLSSLTLFDQSIHGTSTGVIVSDPWILHYTSRHKPWHTGIFNSCALRFFYFEQKAREEYFDYALRSGWFRAWYGLCWVEWRRLVLLLNFKIPRRAWLLVHRVLRPG